jgi:hypothetical protein
MNISKGVNYCLEYHKSNSKETTVRSCEFVLSRFERYYGYREIDSITSDDIMREFWEEILGTLHISIFRALLS